MSDRLRPALRYFGGKYLIAPWIVGYLPEHDIYLEPFGGSAAVLLAKGPSRVEVLNDLDKDVVVFFRVLRDRPDELQRAVRLTPFSRYEYELAREPYEGDDDLERARRLFVLSWQGFGGLMRGNVTGWRSPTRRVDPNAGGCSVAATTWSRLNHLKDLAERLRRVSIECRPALELLPAYDLPLAVYYVDPPYLLGVRRRPRRAYRHEIHDDDHVELLDALNGLEHASVVLSGYHHELYEARLGGWEMVSRPATTNNAARPSTEVLWLNPAAQARLHPVLPFEGVR